MRVEQPGGNPSSISKIPWHATPQTWCKTWKINPLEQIFSQEEGSKTPTVSDMLPAFQACWTWREQEMEEVSFGMCQRTPASWQQQENWMLAMMMMPVSDAQLSPHTSSLTASMVKWVTVRVNRLKGWWNTWICMSCLLPDSLKLLTSFLISSRPVSRQSRVRADCYQGVRVFGGWQVCYNELLRQ